MEEFADLMGNTLEEAYEYWCESYQKRRMSMGRG